MKLLNHVFFKSFTKMIFRFLMQIDFESKKTIDTKITITIIFSNQKISECENRDDNDFSNFETYKYTSSRIFVAKHTKKF